MTRSVDTSAGRPLALTAALVLLMAAPALRAAPAEDADTRRESQQIRRAFRELRDAVREDRRPSGRAEVATPRPAKVVRTPTLDAAGLDALLDRTFAAARAPVARLTTDEEFLRRVCLDVTGKLPAPEEVASFVRDRSREKRSRLIDRLLDSRDYAENWARYWRDVIRFQGTNENLAQINYPGLQAWLAGRLAENAPWDEIATGLITAEGRNDENGATAFALAHTAQAVELAGEVARIFLGVQIQCAQCHDHPTDPWKREQFHEFAAFFSGLKTRRISPPGKDEQGRPTPPIWEVVARGKHRYQMPDLKDPKKQIPVAPKFFLARDAQPLPIDLPSDARRAAVAASVTAQDNPYFARAFVNRIWAALMGEGFYNPVDDMGPGREAHDPEVLDALASQWQQGGYDVRWLFRTILNTKAYQREARATTTSAGRTPFASNCPGRLRADQIVDALAHALGVSFDGLPGGGKGPGKVRGGGQQEGRVQQVAAARRRGLGAGPRGMLNLLFGIDPSLPVDEVLGTIPQALFLMNNPQINRAIRARGPTALADVLGSSSNGREALDRLYLRVLARRPNAREVAACERYVASVGNANEAFEDILWALINSTEFVSRR